MPWVSFLAIFFVAWFLALFIVLPIGVRREETPEPGHDTGAPQRPHMWWKALGATGIALVATAVMWWGFGSGLISFRE